MNRQNKPPQFSAVIFDLDGLVLDTEKTYFMAWKQTASAMGFKFTDNFCSSLSGLQFQQVEQRLLNTFGADFDLSLFNQLSAKIWREIAEQQGIPVKKGFFNVLEQLKNKGIPFCLATNSQQSNAIECLELAGLAQVFSKIISREQVRQGKPAPDIFKVAAKALSIPINQCLILEDSPIGIQAAVKAGAVSVFIPSIHPFQSSTVDLADYFYTDLDSIAEIIKNSDFSSV